MAYLLFWNPAENMGKSFLWWIFCWHKARKNIKKEYESGGIVAAQKLLFAYIPDTKGAEGWIIKWLADKYGWKKAGK
jgi:hypothetical protein